MVVNNFVVNTFITKFRSLNFSIKLFANKILLNVNIAIIAEGKSN